MSEENLPYKTIVDMLERILKLEARVTELEQLVRSLNIGEVSPVIANNTPHAEKLGPTQRDKTRYMFEGKEYLKNKLVLAVVTAYVVAHPRLTMQQLEQIFDRSLQGSFGVVAECNEAKRHYADYRIRFFAEADEIVHLIDGDMFVCSQWGVLNLPNFIQRAEQLGFDIKQIGGGKND